MALAKRFLLISVLLFGASYAHATACTGLATCVQYATVGGGSSGASTAVAAYGANNTAGNTLMAILWIGNATVVPIPAFTDSQGNVWTVVGCTSTTTSGRPPQSCFAYAPNCASGANTVTATFSSGSPSTLMTILEYSGLLVAYSYDTSNFSVANTSPAPTNSVLVGNGAPDLLIGFGINDYHNSGTFGASAGWNQVNVGNGSTYAQIATWEQAGVSAGTYTNAVTNNNVISNGCLEAGIVAFRSVLPSGIVHLQDGFNYQASGSSLAAALPFNATSGNLVIVSARNDDHSSVSATISGCSYTWIRAISAVANGYASPEFDSWYAQVGSSGACTATVSWSAGTPANTVVIISEYKGLSTSIYALEAYATSGAIVSTPVVSTLTTAGTSDLLYTFVDSYDGPNTAPSVSMAPSSGQFQTLQFMGPRPTDYIFNKVVSAGPQTNSVAVTTYGTNNWNSGFMLAFRSVLPTVGSLQHATSSASSTTVTTTLPLTVTAGDMIIAGAYSYAADSSLGGQIQAVTDSNSCVYQEVPNAMIQYQTGSLTTFYCPNSAGGTVAVTLTTSPSTTLDLAVDEVRGVATSNPLYSSTIGAIWATGSLTTVTTNNLVLPTGTYYLYSPLGDLTANLPNVYSQTANFQAHNQVVNYLVNVPYYLRQTSDEVVTASTVSNSVTATSNMSRAYLGIAAFSTVPFTGSRPVQSMLAGWLASSFNLAKLFTLPITSGNHLAVYANFQTQGCDSGSGAPSIADTLSNTWTLAKGGTASDYYAVWVSGASTSGVDTVTVTCLSNSSSIAMSMLELAAVSGVDHANGANSASATSLADGGITTTHANELVVGFGGTAVTSSCDANFPLGTGSLTQWRNFTNSACTQLVTWDLLEGSTGTYTNTYTTSPAQIMTAAIIGFAPSGGAGATQPSVQIISKLENKDELWKAFWGEGQ